MYPIVAQHLLAVCYCAQNYGTDAAFSSWLPYTGADGYCREFQIPQARDVRAR